MTPSFLGEELQSLTQDISDPRHLRYAKGPPRQRLSLNTVWLDIVAEKLLINSSKAGWRIA